MAIPDVGAQDPELRNSPIAVEDQEEDQVLRQAVPGTAVCYFNSEAFAQDDTVKSGTQLLRCDRGIWVPAGPADSDNP